MKNKALLVLGASRYQLPMIEHARSKEVRVIVTDNVPDNPGHKVANKSYLVDTTDHQAVLEIATQEKIDGVIAPCTDIAVQTAAFINEKLDKNGVSFQAAQILTSKLKFREFQKKHDFSNPNSIAIENIDITAQELDFSHKWIIKPDRSSGSKGIFIIENQAELIERYPESLAMSVNGKVSIEQFIDGYQGTVEGVIKDGKIQTLFYLDRQTAQAPFVCTIGHRTPSQLHREVKLKVEEALQDLFVSLQVDNTVFDVDYIWDGEKVFILEASPRLGGNSITQLLSLAYDADLLDWAMNSVLFENKALAKIKHTEQNAAVVLLGAEEAGVLTINESSLHKIQQYSWVSSIEVHANNKARVEKFINGRYCLATVFIIADTYDELVERESTIRCSSLFSVAKSKVV